MGAHPCNQLTARRLKAPRPKKDKVKLQTIHAQDTKELQEREARTPLALIGECSPLPHLRPYKLLYDYQEIKIQGIHSNCSRGEGWLCLLYGLTANFPLCRALL